MEEEDDNVPTEDDTGNAEPAAANNGIAALQPGPVQDAAARIFLSPPVANGGLFLLVEFLPALVAQGFNMQRHLGLTRLEDTPGGHARA